jgi:hypothetical protein
VGWLRATDCSSTPYRVEVITDNGRATSWWYPADAVVPAPCTLAPGARVAVERNGRRLRSMCEVTGVEWYGSMNDVLGAVAIVKEAGPARGLQWLVEVSGAVVAGAACAGAARMSSMPCTQLCPCKR